MAIRPEIPDRTPIENVEVEYVGPRKPAKPGFNRVRLLDLKSDEIELATREAFRPGEKLSMTMHVKGVRDFLEADGEVKKCSRINVFKQPAFSVVLQFGKLTSDQAAKVSWAQEQLIPKQRSGPVRREEDRSTAVGAPSAVSSAATAAAERPGQMESVAAARKEVKRPVALLQLIDALKTFQVSNDLILSVIEAAEAGMDVEVLYPPEEAAKPAEEEESAAKAPDTALPHEGVARPMNVYRLASTSRLYFSESGQPVGPPAELIYLSRIRSPESCFAVELDLDTMTHAGTPSFKRGSILIFSTAQKVESGDFAFVKTRMCDEVAQVFFEKNDEVRIRPLNPNYREKVVRRMEVKLMYKLIGHYQDIG